MSPFKSRATVTFHRNEYTLTVFSNFRYKADVIIIKIDMRPQEKLTMTRLLYNFPIQTWFGMRKNVIKNMDPEFPAAVLIIKYRF